MPPLFPLERTFLPFVYEADDENCKKDHHRDEVIADVEFHPRVLERLETALVWGELLRIGTIRRERASDREQHHADREAEQDEEQDRKVLFQHGHRRVPRPLSVPNRGPSQTWCRRGDSNSHGLRHCPLKTACLPISPRRLVSFQASSLGRSPAFHSRLESD